MRLRRLVTSSAGRTRAIGAPRLVTLTEVGSETMAEMARDREQIAGQLLADVAADRLDELDGDLGRIAERLHGLVDASGRLGRPA